MIHVAPKKIEKRDILRLVLMFVGTYACCIVMSALMFGFAIFLPIQSVGRSIIFDNRIGATWGGASVAIQGILQAEFGFTGTAITDAGGEKDTYMTSDFMLRRGGHLTLCNNGEDGLYDTSSPTAVYYLKDATKHILFNKANSNCVQGVAPGAAIWYDMSPWRVGFIVGWCVVGTLLAADAAYCVLVGLGKLKVKERKEPKEDY